MRTAAHGSIAFRCRRSFERHVRPVGVTDRGSGETRQESMGPLAGVIAPQGVRFSTVDDTAPSVAQCKARCSVVTSTAWTGVQATPLTRRDPRGARSRARKRDRRLSGPLGWVAAAGRLALRLLRRARPSLRDAPRTRNAGGHPHRSANKQERPHKVRFHVCLVDRPRIKSPADLPATAAPSRTPTRCGTPWGRRRCVRQSAGRSACRSRRSRSARSRPGTRTSC